MAVTGPGRAADDVFEAERRRLLGLAYRMVGTIADAEDVVQDAWLRWQGTDQRVIERPAAWLTTVTTRLALDRLRARQRRQEDYVGPWLPEPLVSDRPAAGTDPEAAAELADSLTLGFLTVLDRLAPVERAVFLLADVFAVPYAEIAGVVGKSEVACRQIASRSRRKLHESGDHHPSGQDRALVDGLVMAIAVGDIDGVLARLAPDVVCVSDGGANRKAARRPVVGADRVCRFLVNLTRRFADDVSFSPATVNGDAGIVVSLAGAVDLVAAFEVDDGRVAAIHIIRNPDKLAHVGSPPALF